CPLEHGQRQRMAEKHNRRQLSDVARLQSEDTSCPRHEGGRADHGNQQTPADIAQEIAGQSQKQTQRRIRAGENPSVLDQGWAVQARILEDVWIFGSIRVLSLKQNTNPLLLKVPDVDGWDAGRSDVPGTKEEENSENGEKACPRPGESLRGIAPNQQEH